VTPVEEPEEALQIVEDILGYTFNDTSLLYLALRHRSYVNELGLPTIESNERLEFLGDSVVELSVTHVIYEDFPDYPEGELTKLRSPLVRGKALAGVAKRIGLDQCVLLGRGEEMTGGREKQSILADTFEAVVGALYLDGGFDVARGFVISCLEQMIQDIVRWGPGDHKSELQELATKRLKSVPRYRIRDEGPDHFKTFHATVQVGGKSFGPVAGSSKKEAEQAAARLALVKFGWRKEREARDEGRAVRAGGGPRGHQDGARGGRPRGAGTPAKRGAVAGGGRARDGGVARSAPGRWRRFFSRSGPRG
jgi:ribonuclease-3